LKRAALPGPILRVAHHRPAAITSTFSAAALVVAAGMIASVVCPAWQPAAYTAAFASVVEADAIAVCP
jgi:hypothetical protein